MADFFADLLPKQVSQNASQQPPDMQDDVLVSPTHSGSEPTGTRSAVTPFMAGHPMVGTDSDYDARDRAPTPPLRPLH